MKIFDKILELLENQKVDAKELQFGNNTIVDKLGKGEQGLVLKIKNKIDKHYALKFYSPISTTIDISKLISGLQSFKKEIDITKELNHKNIVKIITGGCAKWNESEKKWEIEEGFTNVSADQLQKDYVLFYIMDFIDGCGLEEIFAEIPKKEIEKIKLDNPEIDEKDKVLQKAYKALEKANAFSKKNSLDKVKLFESLIAQVSDAVSFFNSKDVFHTDIKPDNIRFSKADKNFVIVDFGFARDLFHKNIPVKTDEEEEFEKSHWRHYKVYDDTESHKKRRADRYSKVDMFQFSSLLTDILPEFNKFYHVDRMEGLQSCFFKASGAWDNRYKNLTDFYTSVKMNFIRKSNWRLYIANGEYLTPTGFGRFKDSPILIPPNRLVYFTEEIQKIIDCSEFQRMKEVRQLGPTKEVFPGAGHTRFEHSLGVYWLSLRYLERLLKNHNFRMACEPIEQTIKLTVLAALLHDIGHYPYSHWIEEIKYKGSKERPLQEIKAHETRATDIIDNGQIGKIIKDFWQKEGEDLITPLKKILGNDVHNEDDNNDKRLQIINSIINSQLDADKLDYLIRDSIHTGTFYGLSIDVERFLMCLCINQNKDHIGLTSKGKQVFTSYITARNNMYEGVYWHKTVRCAEAMFKKAFYIYLENTIDTEDTINSLLENGDDHFVKYLFYWLKENSPDNASLMSPFVYKSERLIYKPVYIYFQNVSEENESARHFFASLFGCKSLKDIIVINEKLISSLNEQFPKFEGKLGSSDVLLETTPLRPYNEDIKLEKEFTFYNERKKNYEGASSFFNDQLGYLEKNKQAYMFCHPKYESTFKEIFKSERQKKEFYTLLKQIT